MNVFGKMGFVYKRLAQMYYKIMIANNGKMIIPAWMIWMGFVLKNQNIAIKLLIILSVHKFNYKTRFVKNKLVQLHFVQKLLKIIIVINNVRIGV